MPRLVERFKGHATCQRSVTDDRYDFMIAIDLFLALREANGD